MNNNGNNQLTITQINKANIIERPFLETVHEEDLTNFNENQEINSEKNPKKSITSISIQPTVSNEIKENQKDTISMSIELKSELPKEIASNVESQLYEQLNQLKPLRSKYFKTSTSICLNRDKSSTQTNESHSFLQQENSTNITPNQLMLSKKDSITEDLISDNEKNNLNQAMTNFVKSPSTSLNSSIVSYSSLTNSGCINKYNNNNKLSVKLIDSAVTIIQNNNSKEEASIEQENQVLSNKMNDNVYGASDSLNINKTNNESFKNSTDTVVSTSNLELNFNKENDKIKSFNSLVSRKNSSIVTQTSTGIAIQNNDSPALESSCSENKNLNQNLMIASVQRRVSLSVTDL